MIRHNVSAPLRMVALSISLHCLPGSGAETPRLIQRPAAAIGKVVSTLVEDEFRPKERPKWLPVGVEQKLLNGDSLRTGIYGELGMVLGGEARIRLYQNSLLLLKSVPAAGESSRPAEVALKAGSAWFRAHPQGNELLVQTPTAIAWVRGTDLHLAVGTDGTTSLVVPRGSVELRNDFGAVKVTPGLVGTARRGEAPFTSRLVNPSEQRQWLLHPDLDWLLMFPMLPADERQAPLREGPDEQLMPTNLSPAETLLQSRRLYDSQLYRQAGMLLDRLAPQTLPAASRASASLLNGLVQLQLRQNDGAEETLARAIPDLRGTDLARAWLGRIANAISRGAPRQAETFLVQMKGQCGQCMECLVAEAWVRSNSRDYDSAVDAVTEQRAAFASDSRYHLTLAYLQMLAGNESGLAQALETARGLEPDSDLRLLLMAIDSAVMHPDPQACRRATSELLRRCPNLPEAWVNLGNLNYATRRDRAAEAAFRRAIRLDPGCIVAKSNLAFLLVNLNRFAEAEAVLADADPERADVHARLAQGLLALFQGRNDKAIGEFLAASVLNPSLAAANTYLAEAYYHDEQPARAAKALGDASRLDPHDPLPELLASAIAQDQFRPGDAIRHAEEALHRCQGVAVLDLADHASTRQGSLSLGSAYSGVGLVDWGRYYSELVHDPFSPDYYFFLSENITDSDFVRQANVGLLLDPLTVATPNRHTQFVRQPFDEMVVGASMGTRDEHGAYSGQIEAQGMRVAPFPWAYSMQTTGDWEGGSERCDGRRNTTRYLGVDLAAEFTYDTRGRLSLAYYRENGRYPGPDLDYLADDESQMETYRSMFGVSHRFAADSILMALVDVGRSTYRETNRNPYGWGVGDVDYSLMQSFGLANARLVHEIGLFDFPVGVPVPVVLIGDDDYHLYEDLMGLARLASSIPDVVDPRLTMESDTRTTYAEAHLRHMLRLGAAELTYGLAGSLQREDQYRTMVVPELVAGSAVGVFSWSGTIFEDYIPHYRPSLRSVEGISDSKYGSAYADALLRLSDTLRIQGGLYLHHSDEEGGLDRTQLDPRIGIAWEPLPGQWLRFAYRRELENSLRSSLEPVGSCDLTPGELPVLAGNAWYTSQTDYRLRWDAVWNRRLFTFVEAGHRDIEGAGAMPRHSFNGYVVDDATVDDLVVGTNVWLLENMGIYAWNIWYWTDDEEALDSEPGALSLIPETLTEFGIVYIHPSRITVSAGIAHWRNRVGDLDRTEMLDDYTALDVGVSWLSPKRHWLFSIGLLNALNDTQEIASDYRGTGTTFVFSSEYRF